MERCQKYLFGKSLEIIEIGCNVILDWGLWMKEERIEAPEREEVDVWIENEWR